MKSQSIKASAKHRTKGAIALSLVLATALTIYGISAWTVTNFQGCRYSIYLEIPHLLNLEIEVDNSKVLRQLHRCQ
ncbi:MAG: hypothetical protein F6K47_20865 [Symploca sp. SIO2E6]|nr:hypothetical protein [Symploca sp. SIO2E6]